ncbi:hypothetical protein [Spiroplasma clarkii]|nr:hypothetical protein [Spiroplasma clarkii]
MVGDQQLETLQNIAINSMNETAFTELLTNPTIVKVNAFLEGEL